MLNFEKDRVLSFLLGGSLDPIEISLPLSLLVVLHVEIIGRGSLPWVIKDLYSGYDQGCLSASDGDLPKRERPFTCCFNRQQTSGPSSFS